MARKGQMGGGLAEYQKARKRVGLIAWTWTSQYVELHKLYKLSTGWVIRTSLSFGS